MQRYYIERISAFLLFATLLVCWACSPCNLVDCAPVTQFPDSLPIQANGDAANGGFTAAELASTFVIKTVKGDLTARLDTFAFETGDEVIIGFFIGPSTLFQDEDWDSYDYIVKGLNPEFEHTVTDIVVEGEVEVGKCCEYYINTKKEFRWDGVKYVDADLPLIFDK